MRAFVEETARAFLSRRDDWSQMPCYAVRHQSLRDLLTGSIPPRPNLQSQVRVLAAHVQAAHHHVTTALTPHGATGKRDWDTAGPYARQHLAAHSATCGELDTLVSDPGFLLTADPGSVLAQRAKLRTMSGKRALAVTAASFVLVALIPGDAARAILGTQASQQQYESLRRALGLDNPLWVRYLDWLGGAVHGDLGTSLFSQQPVGELLNQRVGVSLSLVFGATLLSAAVGITLGIMGAIRRGPIDTAVSTVGALGIAIPDFFLGLVLVTIFALRLRWFPSTGYISPSQSVTGWLGSLALPVLTLSAAAVAVIARQTREATREVLARPFMRTLRAAGLPSWSLILKHALRNAAIPVVTVVGLVFVGVLSGSVIVESVFALPGLGSAAVQATSAHDLPVIQGCIVYFTILVVVVNLFVDLLYGLLDPRIRMS